MSKWNVDAWIRRLNPEYGELLPSLLKEADLIKGFSIITQCLADVYKELNELHIAVENLQIDIHNIAEEKE